MKELAHSDLPESADRYDDLHVQAGDIVILATDGIFNTLFNKHIIDIFSSMDIDEGCGMDGRMLLHAARRICMAALSGTQTRGSRTPSGARQSTRCCNYVGGTPDDRTVIVAQVFDPASESQVIKDEKSHLRLSMNCSPCSFSSCVISPKAVL